MTQSKRSDAATSDGESVGEIAFGQIPFAGELMTAIAAARSGAAIVQRYYDAFAITGADPVAKLDGSPVTAADLASDAEIRRIIGAAFPDDAMLTEEGVDDPIRLDHQRVWIADPLDGTKEFVARSGDFDVLVGLARDGQPVAGAACHPPSGDVWCAALGGGAWFLAAGATTPESVRFPKHTGRPRVMTSIWYGAPATLPALRHVTTRLGADEAAVNRTGVSPRYFAGARTFDIFIGLVPDSYLSGGEWDLIVTDLFVREAGGACTDLWGESHRYNQSAGRNSGGLVITTDAANQPSVLDSISPELPRRR